MTDAEKVWDPDAYLNKRYAEFIQDKTPLRPYESRQVYVGHMEFATLMDVHRFNEHYVDGDLDNPARVEIFTWADDHSLYLIREYSNNQLKDTNLIRCGSKIAENMFNPENGYRLVTK